jgi:flagellar biosynthesis/type III secretory pathway chaperone
MGGVMNEVSNILWRERHLLELLLFKLEEEQLLLAAGRARWLSHATREVEMVLEELKTVELSRAVASDAAGRELGLGADASLRALADAAPPPWRDLLHEHRRAFLELTEELVGTASTNRELLARGSQAAQDMLASLDEGRISLYDATGATTTGSAGGSSLLLDEVL